MDVPPYLVILDGYQVGYIVNSLVKPSFVEIFKNSVPPDSVIRGSFFWMYFSYEPWVTRYLAFKESSYP